MQHPARSVSRAHVVGAALASFALHGARESMGLASVQRGNLLLRLPELRPGKTRQPAEGARGNAVFVPKEHFAVRQTLPSRTGGRSERTHLLRRERAGTVGAESRRRRRQRRRGTRAVSDRHPRARAIFPIRSRAKLANRHRRLQLRNTTEWNGHQAFPLTPPPPLSPADSTVMVSHTPLVADVGGGRGDARSGRWDRPWRRAGP